MIFFNVFTWHTIKEIKLVFHLDLVHFIYLFFLLYNFYFSHRFPSKPQTSEQVSFRCSSQRQHQRRVKILSSFLTLLLSLFTKSWRDWADVKDTLNSVFFVVLCAERVVGLGGATAEIEKAVNPSGWEQASDIFSNWTSLFDSSFVFYFYCLLK